MTTTCPPTRNPWHKGPLLGFDTETTGVDIERERIVTAAIIYIEPGQDTRTLNRLANPGIDIPKAASDIHGVTTEHAAQHGEPPADVLEWTVSELAQAIRARTPIVTMNGVFDLTILDRECRRHGVERLSDRVERVAPIIDILVLDKAMDKYRKGSRNLGALCAHYGITLDNAHNSAADALAACRIAYKLCERYPALQIDPTTLHNHQTHWAAGQRASFAAHRARTGQPLHNDDQDGTWPIRPTKTLTGAAK